jgi:hypothetical protein
MPYHMWKDHPPEWVTIDQLNEIEKEKPADVRVSAVTGNILFYDRKLKCVGFLNVGSHLWFPQRRTKPLAR